MPKEWASQLQCTPKLHYRVLAVVCLPNLIRVTCRVSSIRLMGIDREEIGVVSLDEARAMAREEGVDVVMITPGASPPVCRLVKFSKFKYEAEKVTKAKQKASKR